MDSLTLNWMFPTAFGRLTLIMASSPKLMSLHPMPNFAFAFSILNLAFLELELNASFAKLALTV